MFGSGFGNSSSASSSALQDERTTTATEAQRAGGRRAGVSSGLFAVPEDREVLRTPQENQNSGFVFGMGAPHAAENNAADRSDAQTTEPVAEGSGENAVDEPTTPRSAVRGEGASTSRQSETQSAEEETPHSPPSSPAATSRMTNGFVDASSPPPSVRRSGVDSDPASPRARPPRETFSTDVDFHSTDFSPPRERITSYAPPPPHPSTQFPGDDRTVSTSMSLLLAPPSLGTPVADVGNQPDTFGHSVTGMRGQAALQPFMQSYGYQGGCVSGYSYPGPTMQEIVGCDRVFEEMQSERDRNAVQFASESHTGSSSYSGKMKAMQCQIIDGEIMDDNKEPSWLDQWREGKEKTETKQQRWMQAAKRSREANEEEDALVSEAERTRKEVSYQNTLRMLKEAEGDYQREEDAMVLNTDQIRERLPRPFLYETYYMKPTREEMKEIVINCGEDALQAVQNVTFGRRGYGEIFFEGPVNLEKLDLSKELEIKRGHILMKDVETLAGLPAKITLHHVYKHLFVDVQSETEKALREFCDEKGHHFISYNQHGTWMYMVENLKGEDD